MIDSMYDIKSEKGSSVVIRLAVALIQFGT